MVLGRLWTSLRQRQTAARLQRHAVPDALWDLTMARYPFLGRRTEADRQRLRMLTSLFLSEKEFSGAAGQAVTDEVAVSIAAQACLPVLTLGLDWYDGFVGIVVYPDEVVARREVMDDDGVVHLYDEALTGEAMSGGPVVLSWRDVAESSEVAGESAYNVVIHEFAHVLDMRDGEADGLPPIADPVERREWIAALDEAYAEHVRAVDEGEDTVVDPYGAEGAEEFFAVSSESFFIEPRALRQAHPAWYVALSRFYRQDPSLAEG